jgi:hypothetical protein
MQRISLNPYSSKNNGINVSLFLPNESRAKPTVPKEIDTIAETIRTRLTDLDIGCFLSGQFRGI